MISDPWFMLLVGFLGGWLVQLFIDRFFLRPRLMRLLGEKAGFVDKDKLTVRVIDQQNLIADLTSGATLERARLEKQIAKLEIELRIAQEKAAKAEQPVQVELPFDDGSREPAKVHVKAAKRDRLSRIKGIGPKYESLLWQAGVRSFEQLSVTSAAEIEAIIQPESWKKLDYDEWIREAGVLGGKSS